MKDKYANHMNAIHRRSDADDEIQMKNNRNQIKCKVEILRITSCTYKINICLQMRKLSSNKCVQKETHTWLGRAWQEHFSEELFVQTHEKTSNVPGL